MRGSWVHTSRRIACWILGAAAMAAGAGTGVMAAEKSSVVDRVELIERPGSMALAVHDGLGVVAVGFGGKEGAGVAVYRLTAEGVGDAEPEVTRFELPDELSEWGSRVLALAFHPLLPVLYVWQDMDVDAPAGTGDEHFDHLVVLSFDEDGSVTEAAFMCRGDDYANRQAMASLAVAPNGSRLFIPNVIRDTDRRFQGAIGYFDLDAAGMPKKGPVPIEGQYDERGLNLVEMRLEPVSIYTAIRTGGATTMEAQQINRLPTGTGFFTADGDILLFGGLSGIGFWDTVDRRQALGEVSIGDWSAGELGGHPQLPVIYLTSRANGDGRIVAMQHADGVPTLMPQRTAFAGATFRSPPQVAGEQNEILAVGGDERLYLLSLDGDGGLSGEGEMVILPGHGSVRAFGWSASANRLIVAVANAQLVSQATRANRVLYDYWDFLPDVPVTFDRPLPSHIGAALHFVEDGDSGWAIDITPTEDRMHNDGLRFDSHPLLVPDGDFKIELRVKPDSSNRGIRLLDKMRDHNRATGYMLNWVGSNDGTATIRVTLGYGRVEDEQNVENYSSEPFQVRHDEWHDVAFTYDGNGRVRIFVDGKLIGDERQRGRRSIAQGNQALSIGDRSGATYHAIPCRIEQVRIYHSMGEE